MKISLKDWVIALDPDDKKVLAQVTQSSGEQYTIEVDDRNRTTKDKITHQVPKEAILANLGDDPPYGRAYGVKVAPIRKKILLKGLGEMIVRRHLAENEEERVVRALTKHMATMKKYNLDRSLPIDLELDEPQGKYAGSYRAYAEGSEHLNLLRLHPKSFDGLPLLIAHEWGHHVYYCLLSNKQQVSWCKLYARMRELTKADSGAFKRMCKDFVDAQVSVNDWSKELEEKEQPLFDAALDYIYDTFGLSTKHINQMVNESIDISIYWPELAMILAETKPLVTEYAMRAPEELFAESFMLYIHARDKLYRPARKLMAKQLAILKRQ